MQTLSKSLIALVLAPVLVAAAVPATAQEVEVPYWAALRAPEVNMRVGPGEDYQISWVYRRPSLPFRVLRMMEGWRLVEDPEGTRGWILARFLTRERGAFVKAAEPVEMRDKPDGRKLWSVAPRVSGKLGECKGGWCRIDVTGHVGWIAQKHLWGAGEP